MTLLRDKTLLGRRFGAQGLGVFLFLTEKLGRAACTCAASLEVDRLRKYSEAAGGEAALTRRKPKKP